MSQQDLYQKSATELLEALACKQISAVELLEETIKRIETVDEKINAMPVRDFETARKQAKSADQLIARGEHKPLLGLPISVKASFDVKGMPNSWGNEKFKSWFPEEDALTVSRLRAAGANIIGKTNVPFMLQDWQTYNDLYGTTNNPWNTAYTPGGSSGGSAAALAAGLVSLELGSDLAGSLRSPSQCCGVLSHKPTQDIIPMRGSSPPGLPRYPSRVDLVAAGPMARSAQDLALSLSILAGPDDLIDGKAYKLHLPQARQSQIKDFRILILESHPLCPTDSEITNAIHSLAKDLEKLSVKITFGDTSQDLAAITRNFALLVGAFGTNHLPDKLYQKSQATAASLAADDMSLEAHFVRGCVMSHRDWLSTLATRAELRRKWQTLFEEYDLILCPPMPTVAFPHDQTNPRERKLIINGGKVPYDEQFIWISMGSLFGLPVTTMPIGKTKAGLPIGMQIIGSYLSDYSTLKFADLLEKQFGRFPLAM